MRNALKALLIIGLVGIVPVQAPAANPVANQGLAHADYVPCNTNYGLDAWVRMSLGGHLRVGKQNFVGAITTGRLGNRPHLVGCGPAFRPFALTGNGTGKFKALCGGEFHRVEGDLAVSTARLVCDATLVTATATSKASMTILMTLRCYRGTCTGDSGNSLMVGNYVRL